MIIGTLKNVLNTNNKTVWNRIFHNFLGEKIIIKFIFEASPKPIIEWYYTESSNNNAYLNSKEVKTT